MKNELILEIGSEEIPALFLEEYAGSINAAVAEEFEKNSLVFGKTQVLYTPRRLALRVSDLLPYQKEKTVESFGPPKEKAFDSSGKPTKAALGFARSHGIDAEQLEVVRRNKGEFIAYKRKIKGIKTSEVLKAVLPRVVSSVHFKKSMRWGYGKTTFARPIRWMMCLYNSKKLEFMIEDIKSGSKSYGHRFVSPEPFSPRSWTGYIDQLRKKDVQLDQFRRKKLIEDQVQKLAAKLGGVVEKNEELIKTVTNLVEYPVVLHGTFEKSFLKIPKEVLISVMQNHQKYFPVFSKGGKLLPYFIFVCGTRVVNNETVIKGNERVLRARFTDAEFFWNEDTKNPLEESLSALKSVAFLSRVGSYAEKTKRIEQLSVYLARRSGMRAPDLTRSLAEAARLSKADLTSKMVFELPELQGTMGKHYAKKSGVKTLVATAIEEHYMPRERNGMLPRTEIGALLSIADKIDNISSCFATDLKPTGSADPHALRRQAIGIIQIILKKRLSISLKAAFESSLKKIEVDADKKQCLVDIISFISERFKNLMLDEGFSNNVVDSVLSTGFDNAFDSYNRIKAMQRFKEQKNFEQLTVVFKRIVNITKDAPKAKLNARLFKDRSERLLYKALKDVRKKTDGYLRQNGNSLPDSSDYVKTLSTIKTMRKPVDRFFSSVMVMDKDVKLRNNRLALLREIKELFFRIYDFSRV